MCVRVCVYNTTYKYLNKQISSDFLILRSQKMICIYVYASVCLCVCVFCLPKMQLNKQNTKCKIKS